MLSVSPGVFWWGQKESVGGRVPSKSKRMIEGKDNERLQSVINVKVGRGG